MTAAADEKSASGAKRTSTIFDFEHKVFSIEGGYFAMASDKSHAVFFVPDAEGVALAEHGPLVEHHPLFPERTNVEIVQVLSPSRLLTA